MRIGEGNAYVWAFVASPSAPDGTFAAVAVLLVPGNCVGQTVIVGDERHHVSVALPPAGDGTAGWLEGHLHPLVPGPVRALLAQAMGGPAGP